MFTLIVVVVLAAILVISALIFLKVHSPKEDEPVAVKNNSETIHSQKREISKAPSKYAVKKAKAKDDWDFSYLFFKKIEQVKNKKSIFHAITIH